MSQCSVLCALAPPSLFNLCWTRAMAGALQYVYCVFPRFVHLTEDLPDAESSFCILLVQLLREAHYQTPDRCNPDDALQHMPPPTILPCITTSNFAKYFQPATFPNCFVSFRSK